MAWSKFVVQNGKPNASTGLKVTLRKMKASPAALGLTLLGNTGVDLDWADGDKLEVMIGDGAHHGLVRLRKNNSVGTALVVGKKAIHDSYYLKILLGHVPGFVDRSEPARWAKFERAEDAWVEITLPLWASETAPAGASKAAAPTPVSLAHAANFQRPRRDAAPGLMGDPPSGRSALAGKS